MPISSTLENVGLRKIGLRRSPSAPDTWDIFVAVQNYGVRPQSVDLGLQFAKSPAGLAADDAEARRGGTGDISLTPPRSGGFLEARLNVRDAFPQDDRAVIELPAEASSHVVVYSNEPELLRPLISSQSAGGCRCSNRPRNTIRP